MNDTKYHVNPYTYKVMPCNAQIKCDYADHPDTKHFDKDNIDDALTYAEDLGSKSYNKIQTLKKERTEGSKKEDFTKQKQKWNLRKEKLSPEALHNYMEDRAKEIIVDCMNLKEKNKKDYMSFAEYDETDAKTDNNDILRVKMIHLHNENRQHLDNFAYLMSKEDIRSMIEVQNKIRVYFPNFSAKDTDNMWGAGVFDVYGDDNKSYEEVMGLNKDNSSPVDEELSEQEMHTVKQTVKIAVNSALDYPSYGGLKAKGQELQKAFILRKTLKTNNVSNILDRFNDFKEFESRIMDNKTVYERHPHSYHMAVKNYNFKKVRSALSNS